jgi:dTDP-6-deoxy-L-talose 4-dehydrogenase (NAD+)
MKIFVTGGTGFIGKPTVKLLAKQGHELLLLVPRAEITRRDLVGNTNIKFVAGDLSNLGRVKGKIEGFRPVVVLHMAWEGIPDYGWRMSLKNLVSGLNLFKELSYIRCKKIVALGSCWEYSNPKGKLKESSATRPESAFSVAKNSLHCFGRLMAKELCLDFVWLRPFYVYGVGQKSSSLIPYLIKNAREGRLAKIKSPDAKNDFIYVDDVARAIAKATTSPTGRYAVYNVGSGKLTSVRTVVDTVYRELGMGNKLRKVFDKKRPAGAAASFYADISRIRRDLGWTPSVDFKEGIKKVVLHENSDIRF